MSELGDRLQKELEPLQAARDDLRVRLHLGKAEIRDRWELLEKSWHHAEAKLNQIRKETEESTEDIAEALRLLADEIRDGYEHLRKHL
jgi:hypothetical protein